MLYEFFKNVDCQLILNRINIILKELDYVIIHPEFDEMLNIFYFGTFNDVKKMKNSLTLLKNNHISLLSSYSEIKKHLKY